MISKVTQAPVSQRISVALLLQVLAILFFLLLPSRLSASDEVLTHAQIAAANKPGTVMILTVWASTFSIPQEQFKVRELAAFADHEVNHGIIQDTVQARWRAELDEFLAHPEIYLAPSAKNKSGRVETWFSGSGFIVTDDGYIVTNAHVVYKPESEIKDAIVDAWKESKKSSVDDSYVKELNDVFTEDYKQFAKFFENAGSQAIRDHTQAFEAVEAWYFTNNLTIEEMGNRVLAARGVVVPGRSKEATYDVCDVRKRGEPFPPGKDVAILKIEQRNLPTVPVGDDNSLKVGDRIAVLGYPAAAEIGKDTGVESSLTEGELSARKTLSAGWSVLQTTAAINPGNSGGPAFNDHGEVIGISTASPRDKEIKGIYYFVPISIAKQFLNELNIKPQQSRLSQLYEQGIAGMSKSCYVKALDKFKEVGDLSPGFPFINDMITEARNAIAQGRDRCWMPDQTYIIGAVATLLIILTAVWLLMRKRPASVAEAPGVGRVQMPDVSAERLQKADSGFAVRPLRTIEVSPTDSQSFGSVQGTAGAVAGKRFPVTKQGLLIGRDASKCQIVLEHDSVSKEHAWIVPIDGGTVVIDRGSTNGTFINSTTSPKISKVRLQNGDKIFIGKGAAVFTYLTS